MDWLSLSSSAKLEGNSPMKIAFATFDEEEFVDQVVPHWPELTNMVTSLSDGKTLRCHLAFMLSAAYCCGWTPAWTQPPKDFEGSKWYGAYIAHLKQIVSAQDAEAMALALEKALPRLAGASEAWAQQSMYLYECFYRLFVGCDVFD